MIELIHVSDLHFGKSRKQTRRAKSLLRKINEQHEFTANQERYLLVTGDITHHGRLSEYKLASKALLPFKDRVLLTPGNHDYGSFFGTWYKKKCARYFDVPFANNLGFKHAFLNKKIFPKVLESADGQAKLMIIGLNSCTKKDLEDFSRGKIGQTQREELTKELCESDPNIPKLVFLHHIPDKEAKPKNIMTLEDWPDLMKIVQGKVKMMAFGHQGRFRKTDSTEAVPASSHTMEVRSLINSQGDEICMLDANNSTKEQAYYRIVADGNGQVTAEKLSFG
jgi:DNA repair exonuclease SbcCD nuclease subunit